MPRFLIIVLAAALAAGPALAQGTFNPGGGRGSQGTFNPGGRPPARPAAPGMADAYRSAPAPRPPAAPAAPAPGGFKPYEPFGGSSVYGAPRPGASGAKPCETSVYVNACPKKP